MQTITKYIIFLVLSLYLTNATAQDSIPESKELQIKKLKQSIEDDERNALKTEVENINDRVIKKEITYEEGENLKQEVAKKRALNIKNRIEILKNKIDFNDRNGLKNDLDLKEKKSIGITIGSSKNNLVGLTVANSKHNPKPVKYDFRTLTGLVVSAGLNNALIDGQSLSDSPYKIGGSGFFELGFQWKTRLLKNSNAIRLRYGLSLQWNKYDLKDNKFIVQDGNVTTIETFPTDLKQAKFRTTNLIVPLYFEFGQYTKNEKKDRIRYYNRGFKIGFGGYAGLNIEAKQKLWYKENGERTKQKIKQDYNVNPFVYGIGAYVGLDDVSLFFKYDLSNTFKNNSIKQNNISLGIRLEIE
ncbi:hypothetical protein [Lacinutrix sp. Bg11-31]|uniref:hypothetical protein n=1 Tax=Lacinutrix sp. Bg11-31 TaxID=2057808 RepID=UPI000C301A82|nr:hypothetical protein [Lacinutrix sp. Bg11-31]AUC83452.1 hypothetical protein CW733_15460 [Lacinutrix sp. Bg11-31]